MRRILAGIIDDVDGLIGRDGDTDWKLVTFTLALAGVFALAGIEVGRTADGLMLSSVSVMAGSMLGWRLCRAR